MGNDGDIEGNLEYGLIEPGERLAGGDRFELGHRVRIVTTRRLEQCKCGPVEERAPNRRFGSVPQSGISQL